MTISYLSMVESAIIGVRATINKLVAEKRPIEAWETELKRLIEARHEIASN